MMQNWILEEMLIEERVKDLQRAFDVFALSSEPRPPALRRAIAGGLVRFGMMLDRTAGERAIGAVRQPGQASQA